MSQSNLSQLREALTHSGWQITENLRGDDDVRGAATWLIRRQIGPTLLIDFAGLGGMGEDIPVEQSYACNVRDASLSLYFRRVNRCRELWVAELTEFVSALEKVATTDSGD